MSYEIALNVPKQNQNQCNSTLYCLKSEFEKVQGDRTMVIRAAERFTRNKNDACLVLRNDFDKTNSN